MNKNLFPLYGMIILALMLATTSVTAQPKPDDDLCQGSVANTVGCSKVWVEVTPAFFPQSPGDHTYVKFLEKNGKWQSYHCFGACNGGNELQDTKSSTWKDNKKIIQYMTDTSPCKWPRYYYLIIGVCHQLANRGLFHTKKIVKNARMYKWSSFVYQTYGACFLPLKEYCMSNCLEASTTISTWREGAPPSCLPSGSERSGPAKPDAEYHLYMDYFGYPKVTMGVQDMAGLLKSYRYKLLAMHIKQRLGDKYLRDYLPILSKGQNELLEKKKVLDLRLFESKRLSDNIINEYNKLFNEYLIRFQAQMPRYLYERFFGLAYGERIDVRIFLPRE